MLLFSVLLLLSLDVSAQPKVEEDVLLLRRAELLNREPDRQGHGVKVWTMRRDEHSRTNLVELRGELPRHIHPDARHTILVLEGEIWFQKGEDSEEVLLVEGDYVSIGAGVPHKYRVRTKRGLIMSFDAPAYNPKETIYLETRPK